MEQRLDPSSVFPLEGGSIITGRSGSGGFASLSLESLFLVVAAPFIGSFLAVVAVRWPTGKSFVVGRSACPHRLHRLSVRDLVPLLSWIMQRGRCRYCAARIEPFYPMLEVGALLVAISAAMFFSGWALWVSCGLGWTLLLLAAIDYRYLILPDQLTLPLIPAGLGVALLAQPESVGGHALGAVLGFAAFAGLAWLYRKIRDRDGLGLGDAKLLAAGGAWVSAAGLPSVVFLAALAALAAVLAAMVLGRRLSATDKVPFGAYLCLGIWLVWLFGPLLLAE